MTPDQVRLYDNYPEWFGHLLNGFNAVAGLPLEDMLAVNLHLTTTGCFITTAGAEQVDPVSMQRQRQVIQNAIVFRDSLPKAEDRA